MSFRNKKYLNHHISQVYQEKVSCDLCGKSITRINNLKRHIDSTHKQIKKFQCEYCAGMFVRATTLEKHKINYCQIKFMKALKCTNVTNHLKQSKL